MSNEIDFTQYTIEELKSSYNAIDRDKFPERANEIKALILERMSCPNVVTKLALESDFFNSHIPENVVFSIFLKHVGWNLILMLLVVLPVGFVLGIILALLGLDKTTIEIIAIVFQLVTTFVVSFIVLRKVLGSKYKNFEIVFLQKEHTSHSSRTKNSLLLLLRRSF